MSDILLTESEVFAALQVLFASNGRIDRSILDSIGQSQVKKAFRKRALETHPDRFSEHGDRFKADCTRRFIEVTNAYETLNRFLKLRERDLGTRFEKAPTRPPLHRNNHAGRHRPGPSSAHNTPKDEGFARFHRGGIPSRPLRIGEFLYHSGVISWKSLINALVWQRKQRPRLGEIAQKWRWLTEEDVAELLRNRQAGELFGEVLLRHDLINPFQLNVLLWHQRRMQKPLGHYFVDQGVVTEAEVDRYLMRLQTHNNKWWSDRDARCRQ